MKNLLRIALISEHASPTNPMLARTMGRAGVLRARSMFTWVQVVSRDLTRVYDSLLAGPCGTTLMQPTGKKARVASGLAT